MQGCIESPMTNFCNNVKSGMALESKVRFNQGKQVGWDAARG
jgi:hypothetical protein